MYFIHSNWILIQYYFLSVRRSELHHCIYKKKWKCGGGVQVTFECCKFSPHISIQLELILLEVKHIPQCWFCGAVNYSMIQCCQWLSAAQEKLEGHLLLELKFVRLQILSISFRYFLYEELGELRSRSLSLEGLRLVISHDIQRFSNEGWRGGISKVYASACKDTISISFMYYYRKWLWKMSVAFQRTPSRCHG